MGTMPRLALRAALLFILAALPAGAAGESLTAREIVARAFQAMGGAHWAKARTLYLEGRIVWYAPDRPEPRAAAEDYRMWRILEDERPRAHEAAGMVRIVARAGGQTVFEIASDGEVTWTERGVVPPAQAAEIWANNFGFGVIRHALKEGFRLERLPDDWAMGSPVHMVRVVDPGGTETLFGIDQADFRVRMAGFRTPRGWHVRTYDRFFLADGGRWVQPGRVTLYYNGVKQNEVIWERAEVNLPLSPEMFRVGAPLPPR